MRRAAQEGYRRAGRHCEPDGPNGLTVALYSRRFWDRLSTLDARMVEALRLQHEACGRLLLGRRVIVGATLDEFHQELRSCSYDAYSAVLELHHFCIGRSASQSEAAARHPPETLTG